MNEYDEEYLRVKNRPYFEAKGRQHQRALEFMAEAKEGDEYKIERYAIEETGIPYELSRYKDVHERKIIKIFAMNRQPGALWFTTYKGEAISAESLIKWLKLPKQQELF